MMKSWKRAFKPMLVLMLAFSMIWLAGCQSIAGVDLNKGLQSALDRDAFEGNASFTIELNVNDQASDTGQAELFKWLNPITVSVDELKANGDMNVYAKGSLSYSHGKIPFEIAADHDQLVIQLEGIEKPLVLSSASLSSTSMLSAVMPALGGSGLSGMTGVLGALPLEQVAPDLIRLIGKYAIAKFPNPSNIQLEAVNDGSDLRHQVNMEIKGAELIELISKLVANIAQDESGVKALLGDIYDLIIPVIKAQQAEGSSSIPPLVMGILNNKNQAVQFLYNFISDTLEQFTNSADGSISDLKESFPGLFSDSTALQLNVYFDDAMELRKVQFALQLDLENGTNGTLSGIKISGAHEVWNVNGDVNVPTMAATNAISLSDGSGISGVIKHVDRNSDLYKLMKAAGVTTKTVTMNLKDGADAANGPAPYIDAKLGRTYVPVRLASEQLDAEVTWDNTKKEVTVVDAWNGVTIVMTLGSETALINQVETKLDAGLQIKDGSTYVPISFIAQALKVQVGFDNDTKVVTLTREY